jgi:hypothetical protein
MHILLTLSGTCQEPYSGTLFDTPRYGALNAGTEHTCQLQAVRKSLLTQTNDLVFVALHRVK